MSITDFYISQSTIPCWTWYPMDVDRKFWPEDGDKVIVVNKRKILNSDKYAYDYCVATARVDNDHFYFDILGSKKYHNLVRWTKIMDIGDEYKEVE